MFLGFFKRFGRILARHFFSHYKERPRRQEHPAREGPRTAALQRVQEGDYSFSFKKKPRLFFSHPGNVPPHTATKDVRPQSVLLLERGSPGDFQQELVQAERAIRQVSVLLINENFEQLLMPFPSSCAVPTTLTCSSAA